MRFFFSRPGLEKHSAAGIAEVTLKSARAYQNKTIPFSHIYASSNDFFKILKKSILEANKEQSVEEVSLFARQKILQDTRFPKDLASFNFHSYKALQACFSNKKNFNLVIFTDLLISAENQEHLLAQLQRLSNLLSPCQIRFHIVTTDKTELSENLTTLSNVFFYPGCLAVKLLLKSDFYLNVSSLDDLPFANKINDIPLDLPKVGIVIPHFGSQEKLNLCVSALLDVKGFDPRWLYVVDNNKNNRYFTKGVNHGLTQALDDDCDYLWILNNDTQPEENYIQACLQRFTENKKIGIIGGKNLVTNKPDRIFWGGSHQAFPSGVHKAGYVSKGSLAEASRESWATFSSVIIRRKTMDECGLLDKTMQMIFSDSDYCFQAGLKGWQVWYEPEAVILHDTGVSRSTPNETLRAIFKQDKIHFYQKWSAITQCKEPKDLQEAIFKKINFQGSIANL